MQTIVTFLTHYKGEPVLSYRRVDMNCWYSTISHSTRGLGLISVKYYAMHEIARSGYDCLLNHQSLEIIARPCKTPKTKASTILLVSTLLITPFLKKHTHTQNICAVSIMSNWLKYIWAHEKQENKLQRLSRSVRGDTGQGNVCCHVHAFHMAAVD